MASFPPCFPSCWGCLEGWSVSSWKRGVFPKLEGWRQQLRAPSSCAGQGLIVNSCYWLGMGNTSSVRAQTLLGGLYIVVSLGFEAILWTSVITNPFGAHFCFALQQLPDTLWYTWRQDTRYKILNPAFWIPLLTPWIASARCCSAVTQLYVVRTSLGTSGVALVSVFKLFTPGFEALSGLCTCGEALFPCAVLAAEKRH